MALIDFYEMLGVARNADQETIRKAWRKKQLEYHPDRHGQLPPEFQQLATVMSQKINEAYEVLKDPKKRVIYDALLNEESGQSGHGSTSASETSHEERRRYEQAREERERRESARRRQEREQAAAEQARKEGEDRVRREKEAQERAEQQQVGRENRKQEVRKGILALILVFVGIPVVIASIYVLYTQVANLITGYKPIPPGIWTSVEMATIEGWKITCFKYNDNPQHCHATKGKLVVGIQISEGPLAIFASHDGGQRYIMFLQIDNRVFYDPKKGGGDGLSSFQQNLIKAIIHAMRGGKVAHIEYTFMDSNSHQKDAKNTIQLGDFNKVYLELERVWAKWK